MTLPANNLAASQINTELGYAATATMGLNDAAVRGLAGKASGQIAYSDLLSKSAALPTINLTPGLFAPFIGYIPITTGSYAITSGAFPTGSSGFSLFSQTGYYDLQLSLTGASQFWFTKVIVQATNGTLRTFTSATATYMTSVWRWGTGTNLVWTAAGPVRSVVFS